MFDLFLLFSYIKWFVHSAPDATEKKKRTAQSLVLVFSFLVFSFSSPNKSHAKVDIYMNQKNNQKKNHLPSPTRKQRGGKRATT